MKKMNLLWIITIVNSVVLIIIVLVFIASMTYPAQSESNELREWVQKQLDLNVEHVEKELKKQNEYNEANTKRIFDYVNSR